MTRATEPAKQPTRLDIVKAKYEHFVKSGGSSRQNVDDLLKAVVEALTDEPAYTKPAPKSPE